MGHFLHNSDRTKKTYIPLTPSLFNLLNVTHTMAIRSVDLDLGWRTEMSCSQIDKTYDVGEEL